MSFTQTSQHAYPDGEERLTQCFRRFGQPQSQRCHAPIETDDDGTRFVHWRNIQELYAREGEVKFVVDGNVLVHKAVGHDMQLIEPWRIQAFPNKVLQVALNDEQPGCLGPETSANVDPNAMADDNSESGSSPSYSSRPSKKSNAWSSSSSSSSSFVFMPEGTRSYTTTSSSSPLVLPPPVVATAPVSRSPTAVCSEVEGPSSFTRSAAASTAEAASFSFPHVKLGVVQDARNTFPFLSSTCLPDLAQAQVDHALGKLYRSSSFLPPSHPSPPSLCCPRCRHHTRADGLRKGSTQMFTPPSSTPVLSSHEPTVSFLCKAFPPLSNETPIYPEAKTKSIVDDGSNNNIEVTSSVNHHVVDECLWSERTSVSHLEKSLSSSSSSFLASSSYSTLSPGSPLVDFTSSTYVSVPTGCVNQTLMTVAHVVEDFARLSIQQPASRRSVLMQASLTHKQKFNDESTLFLDDEVQAFFD